jgi:glycine/D-amino acid oxidase-like deaminating enzyme
MKLTSGCIYWPQVDPQAPALPDLAQDLHTQVAIIGCGITGALAAWHLTRESIPTVLLDRSGIATASTSASTGLLQYEIDVPLIQLSRQLGWDHASAAYRASQEALLAFPELVSHLADDCALTPRPSLYLALTDADVPQFQEECAARRSIGIDVEFLSSNSLQDRFGISRPAALLSAHAFEIDPYRLTANLLSSSLAKGLQAFTAEITRYDANPHGVLLRTPQGQTIQARKVIFATGYETPSFLPCDICRLRTTYALVSQPLSEFWPQRPLIWESGQPYFYLRSTADGRAVVGGEDEDAVLPPGPDPLIPAKARILCDKFHTLFPHIPIQPACTWSGIFAETIDGLPYIGSVPQFPHGLFALGYGGNGITFSLVAARILLDAVRGRVNDWSGLFSFDREDLAHSPLPIQRATIKGLSEFPNSVSGGE